MHYRNPALCRVFFFGHSATSLPSANKTLGKKKHSAKKPFAECFFLHLAKKLLCRVFFLHSAKSFFAECFFTLGKENFKTHFEAVN
jgi:hypothetical protein